MPIAGPRSTAKKSDGDALNCFHLARNRHLVYLRGFLFSGLFESWKSNSANDVRQNFGLGARIFSGDENVESNIMVWEEDQLIAVGPYCSAFAVHPRRLWSAGARNISPRRSA